MKRAVSIVQTLLLFTVFTVIATGQQPTPSPPIVASSQTPMPSIEVYIPQGMPIQIEVTRDERELSMTKLNIKRIVGPEVDKVFMIALTIGPDNKLREGPGEIAKNEARITTAKAWEPASVAWASSVDVRRFILVVERVETDTGVWVMESANSEDRRTTLAAIVERGNYAVPRPRFIPR